jgi:hypothetical protein
MSQLGYNSVRPALNSRLFMTETDPSARVEEGYCFWTPGRVVQSAAHLCHHRYARRARRADGTKLDDSVNDR